MPSRPTNTDQLCSCRERKQSTPDLEGNSPRVRSISSGLSQGSSSSTCFGKNADAGSKEMAEGNAARPKLRNSLNKAKRKGVTGKLWGRGNGSFLCPGAVFMRKEDVASDATSTSPSLHRLYGRRCAPPPNWAGHHVHDSCYRSRSPRELPLDQARCAAGLGTLHSPHQPFERRPAPLTMIRWWRPRTGWCAGKAFYPFKVPSEGGKNGTDTSMDHLD
jgi:hypothetical protein